MARRARRRAFTATGAAGPLWLGLAACTGLALWLRSPTPSGGPSEPSGTVEDAAAPAPASDSPALENPVLTWRTEGPRDLPTPPDLLACLAGRNGRTPTLGPARAGGELATEITWLGPTIRQRLAPTPTGEPPGLVLRTAISGRPHAALAAHLALAACVRAGATRLVDVDRGRNYDPAEWPLPLADGGLDVAGLFAQEVQSGLLVTRGLSRLGLPELGVRMTQGLDASTARARLMRGIAAAVVAERVADRLLLDGEAQALGATTVPGVGDVRLLPPASDRAPPTDRRVLPWPRTVPPSPATSPPSRAPSPATTAPLDIDYR
jgi:hypothetical protein